MKNSRSPTKKTLKRQSNTKLLWTTKLLRYIKQNPGDAITIALTIIGIIIALWPILAEGTKVVTVQLFEKDHSNIVHVSTRISGLQFIGQDKSYLGSGIIEEYKIRFEEVPKNCVYARFKLESTYYSLIPIDSSTKNLQSNNLIRLRVARNQRTITLYVKGINKELLRTKRIKVKFLQGTQEVITGKNLADRVSFTNIPLVDPNGNETKVTVQVEVDEYIFVDQKVRPLTDTMVIFVPKKVKSPLLKLPDLSKTRATNTLAILVVDLHNRPLPNVDIQSTSWGNYTTNNAGLAYVIVPPDRYSTYEYFTFIDPSNRFLEKNNHIRLIPSTRPVIVQFDNEKTL